MKKEILIVTGHLEFNTLIGKYLSRRFNVRMAGNCHDAYILFENGFIPDLIISESLMSIPDGNELTFKIKEDIESRNLRVLILSGNEKATSHIELIRTVDNNYLVKPFRLTDLERRVKYLLNVAI